MANKLQIAKLEFEVGGGKLNKAGQSTTTDRLSNKVSGKGKKGGQAVDERAILCWLECQDGTRYILK